MTIALLVLLTLPGLIFVILIMAPRLHHPRRYWSDRRPKP
jgi:hypothetical protein